MYLRNWKFLKLETVFSPVSVFLYLAEIEPSTFYKHKERCVGKHSYIFVAILNYIRVIHSNFNMQTRVAYPYQKKAVQPFEDTQESKLLFRRVHETNYNRAQTAPSPLKQVKSVGKNKQNVESDALKRGATAPFQFDDIVADSSVPEGTHEFFATDQEESCKNYSL